MTIGLDNSPYSQGYKAGWNALAMANPFPATSPEHTQFMEGYNTAKMRRELTYVSPVEGVIKGS